LSSAAFSFAALETPRKANQVKKVQDVPEIPPVGFSRLKLKEVKKVKPVPKVRHATPF
jgi:hypothetical protein